VVYDLAERVTVAERESKRAVVLFGTPEAQPYQAEGFFRWAGGRGDRFVWARREVEVALPFGDVAPRAAVVDWQAFQGVRDQRAVVKLNGTRVADVAVAETRQRSLIPLPVAAPPPGAPPPWQCCSGQSGSRCSGSWCSATLFIPMDSGELLKSGRLWTAISEAGPGVCSQQRSGSVADEESGPGLRCGQHPHRRGVPWLCRHADAARDGRARRSR
jgi:hypothetical protein